MNFLVWVVQVLLAVAFLAHGWLVLAPPPEIGALMLESYPRSFWIFLGVAEIAAAVGLTLPGATRVMPWLVEWAAAGVMIVMIAATIHHLRRGEISSSIITLVLLMMARFFSQRRLKIRPILTRPGS